MGYIKTIPLQTINENCQVFDYLTVSPASSAPAGQAPIVFLPQGFGRGQLLRLHISFLLLHYLHQSHQPHNALCLSGVGNLDAGVGEPCLVFLVQPIVQALE